MISLLCCKIYLLFTHAEVRCNSDVVAGGCVQCPELKKNFREGSTFTVINLNNPSRAKKNTVHRLP